MICMFSIMETTGISALCLFVKTHITLSTDDQPGKQTNDTTENEAKNVEIKEYWAVFTEVMPGQPAVNNKPVKYYPQGDNHHLSWYPPVATPPPNFQV